jgi:transposase
MRRGMASGNHSSRVRQEFMAPVREHRDLILNSFCAHGTVSAGAVEGLNNKAKLTTRKAYGFRTYEAIEIALYHTLGDLPEPEFTHEFC